MYSTIKWKFEAVIEPVKCNLRSEIMLAKCCHISQLLSKWWNNFTGHILGLNAYISENYADPIICFGRRVLIGYLSEVGVKSHYVGIVESQILMNEKVTEKGEARSFLDEIHICNHIGLLAGLMAHEVFRKPIHSNVRLLPAACILIDRACRRPL